MEKTAKEIARELTRIRKALEKIADHTKDVGSSHISDFFK